MKTFFFKLLRHFLRLLRRPQPQKAHSQKAAEGIIRTPDNDLTDENGLDELDRKVIADMRTEGGR